MQLRIVASTLGLATMMVTHGVGRGQQPGQQLGQETPPDAPSIQAAAAAPVPATRPNTEAAVERRRWSGIVEPGETVPRLTLKDKFLFPLHEEARPVVFVPALISGGYGILKDSDPRYGTDSAGFGERFGAGMLRQGTMRGFSDGLLPAIFHEDPRYYRRAAGSFASRTGYAVSRVVIARKDEGGNGFNFSDTLGRGMAAALTEAYYPAVSVTNTDVFRTWGVSLAGLGGINVFQEFWPDIKHRLFHGSR